MQITLDSEKTSFWTLKTIIGDEKTPVEILESLSTLKDGQLLAELALNQSINRKIMETLSEKNHHVAASLASNPVVPSDILDKLAKRDNVLVAKALIANPNTKPETLKKLFPTLDASFYPMLIKNPNLPDKIFSNIFAIACENFKNSARENILLAACESDKLTYDMVRTMLHIGVTPEIARKLIENEAFGREYLARYIKENIYEDFEYDTLENALSGVSNASDIDNELASLLFNSGSYMIAENLAFKTKDESILWAYSHDDDLVKIVIQNENCTESVLKYIYKRRKNLRGHVCFMNHPNLPKMYKFLCKFYSN